MSAAALRRIRQLADFAVAGIWIYQGVVPKMLGPHPDEVAMAQAVGVPTNLVLTASCAAGAGEVLLGLSIVLWPRRAWPQRLSALSTALLLIFVALAVPHFLVGAFNPVVMNVASIALSIVALKAQAAQPAGAR